jgi:glycopeptide antibiotics resistance protein
MLKRFITAVALIGYSAIMISVMIFRDIPTLRIGHLMFKFGGSDADGQSNFVPFKTIVPYLLGKGGLIIAGVNLVGNVALLVPFGFLVTLLCSLLYHRVTWQKSLALSVVTGLSIETMQVVLHTGRFDIDDVILNGLGVMIGYWIFTTLEKRRPAKTGLPSAGSY